MINPNAMSENLLFSTVRLENKKGVGTGFIYMIKRSENMIHPIIITNKHVCNEEKSFIFSLHTIDEKGFPMDEVFNCEKKNLDIVEHPEYDLCCFGFGGWITDAKEIFGKNIFFKGLSEDLIWDEGRLGDLSAVEDIVMYGYPIGLYDLRNVLPLIRKGITSSHPGIDFNGKSIGVIDAACFPGSSGSPVFIMNENMVQMKSGDVSMGSRLILLGVLYSGPVYTSEGRIEVQEIPTSANIVARTNIMVNLGYYIKAKEILKLINIYKAKYNLI